MRPEPDPPPAGRAEVAGAAGRYGRVSRAFHWVMAYLILWQCLMFVGWRVLGEGVMPGVARFGPSHSMVGLLVLALVLPRALWTLLQRGRAPAGAPRLYGIARIARIAHAMLYLLMFVIPALALLRAYGSGKGLMLGTLRVVPATGRRLPVLTAPADLLHAPLGWALAVLLCGHIGMALIHHFVMRDGSLRQMLGVD